ncbi:MAG TPA: GNAT family N-acetyltransferase [Chthonomonadaceae bacterium]|nr:GNAT family N-acetyltransferase [Chthonomonadaceae bacterium]
MEQLAMRRPNLDGLPELPPMPPGYLLRPGCAVDAESLAALLAIAFATSAWTPEKALSELLANPDVKQTYLITCEGRVVATASALLLPETYPGTGIVHYVAADPEHKGRRLGYLVSLAVLHEFARLGCKDALLRTDDPRLPAIKTYLDLGFEPVFIDETHVARWQKVTAALAAR